MSTLAAIVAAILGPLLEFLAGLAKESTQQRAEDAPANPNLAGRLNDRLAAWKRSTAAAGALAVLALAGGCYGPRVVLVQHRDSPVRAGPDMRGRVYVWTGAGWELGRNKVEIPEGVYIWDAGEGTNGLKRPAVR